MTSKTSQFGWLRLIAVTLAWSVGGGHARAQEPPRPGEKTTGAARQSAEVVDVGTVLPLTGSYGEYGQDVLAALQVAADEINEKGGLRVRLLAEDDQADSAKAVAALQALINVHGVKFVVGGFTSSCSEAMYPMAEWSGVLMFSSSTSTPSLTKNTPLFFRNWPSDRNQGRAFASQTMNRFHKKTAAVLYSNSEYGIDAKEAFRQAYEELGGKVVFEQAYAPKTTDFRAQANRFLARPAECIWLFGYYNEMGHFLKQARESGLTTQFFGQEGIEGVELLEIAGLAAEGLIYFVPVFDPADKSEGVRKFVKAFKAKAGREPDVVAAHAYDALHILTAAIKAVGPDPKAVARRLTTVKDYPGVAGLTTLDANGDATKPVMVKMIQDGRFVPWRPPTNASSEAP